MTDSITYKIRIKIGNNEIEFTGDKEWVEERLNEYKQFLGKVKEIQPPKPEHRTDMPDSKSEMPETLAQFYREKGEPKYHADKAIIFSYWLTKKENMNSYNIDDIISCYKDIRISTPKNMTDTMNKINPEYLIVKPDKNNKKAWSISYPGEKHVEAMGKSE